MSFFGQSNNQQSSGFGGFGSNNNSGSGFGQSNNTGFGTTSGTTGGGLFGTSNNNNNSSAFGGFGANASASTPFGGNTSGGFGSNTSTGGGLFGSNTATSGANTGFGGFGGSNANSGGGLFGGGNKPAFGSQQPSTGGSLFGGASNSFGSSNNQTSTGFAGAPISSALGGAVPECQGTGSTPFQALVEKEGVSSNQNNHYQSIAFMQPYKNYSFEELRFADYNQGRRFGNGSGQAGAFGTSTGFGGFGGQNTSSAFGSGNQSTGLFGSQATSAPAFGGNQTATSGFGSNNTSGLFGNAPKPAGAFGSTPSQPSGGGLFGGANQSGGFGSQNNTGTGFGSNQGGGLFGSNNNQQKSGFAFGQNNNNTTGGFGASNNNTSNTGGGLFGSNSTSTPFGGGQQQQTTNPFGGFGNNQQNQGQSNTGSAFGGFGSNDQQKPGGLFGGGNTTSNTGGGLFGNNQNNQQPSSTGGGLFGGANNNQSGSTSLFGPKPAATGTGLFGSNATSNTGNTGGGLFGSNNTNQNQPNQTSSLFGNTNNQQQQKPGGLFGGGGGTGSSLFGNNNNQQQQGGVSSLFSNIPPSNNQQQQSGGLFGNNNNTSSLFSNQQPQQQPANNPLQAPQAYNASIFDPNPYGIRSIFDGLPPPPQQYTGPVATPIGQKKEAKKGAVLPQYRINPLVASRYVTPQKRQQGYGFTYSTYGTPSSVSSNVSTPGGLSSSLLQGSISRGLGKSLSNNNLRRTFDADHESLLSPGAFSAGSSRYGGTGSLKKLTIDRSLRTDLFQSPPTLPNAERNELRQQSILKKRVSFDASTVGGNGEGQAGTQINGVNGSSGDNNGSSSNAEGNSGQGSSSSPQPNGQFNSGSVQPEMEQVKGNELAIINEDGNQDNQSGDGTGNSAPISQYDPKPGPYYMKPSREELAKMSYEQKKKVSNFCVGRQNCGYVVFDVPVNLNDVHLDQIFGGIAQIEMRSLTVYPTAEVKPPRGKGLNVPSTIHLANSWPRARDRKTPLFEKSGPRFQKHLIRLQQVTDTEFVSYDKDTGMWVFKVQHYTTYALDYDDEGDNTFQSSTLSSLPDSPTPSSRVAKAGATPMAMGFAPDSSILSSEMSRESSGPDDTFEFRKKKMLPGAFDDSAMFDEVSEMAESNGHGQSLSNTHPGLSTLDEDERSISLDMDYQNENQSSPVQEQPLHMIGSYPQFDGGNDEQESMPKSILKKTTQEFGTPGKLDFNESGDWAEELRRTISPRKQDRQALRESQARVMQHEEDSMDNTPKAKSKQGGFQPGFANTMDLMNSIFPKEHNRRGKGQAKKAGQGKAFQIERNHHVPKQLTHYPYPKTLATHNDDDEPMDQNAQQWHDSLKPSWGPEGTLLYAIAGTTGLLQEAAHQTDAVMQDTTSKIVSEGRDVRFAKFVNTPSLTPDSLSLQKDCTVITLEQGVPFAKPKQIPLRDLLQSVSATSRNERSVWELASILFDPLEPSAFGTIPASEKSAYEYRVRKGLLSDFWASSCYDKAVNAATGAHSAEERALDYLSANVVVKACVTLAEARDFRLATLVSQLPPDDVMAEDMASQIREWSQLNALSEMTEPIRALYEICAGNVCVSEGKRGVPIEDQVKRFVISQRFGFDWQRAFGLRLWYGIRAEDPIQEAIKLFYDNLAEGLEPVKPLPSFANDTSDEDEGESQPEDVHWGLLKLFAASKHAIPSQSLLDIISPHNTVGNPTDFRLSFQLYHALSHFLPTFLSTSDAANDKARADDLAHSFAAQLESQGEWLWSIFILLHLSSASARKTAIQNTLARHAPAIPANEETDPHNTNNDTNNNNIFSSLTSTFHIPASWIYEAKALEARAIHQDFALEIRFLQKANDWTTAHDTLVHVVGPRCVIEEDWDTLANVLKGFNNNEGGEGTETEMVGFGEGVWALGGGVYQDHLDIVQGGFGRQTLERQLEALPAVVEERGGVGKMGFWEGVAVREMAGWVAEMCQGADDRVLQLPLTRERTRRYRTAMDTKRFCNLMKGSL